MRDKIEAALEAAGNMIDLKDVGSDAMKALRDDLQQVLPAIQKAGYDVHAVDIDVAIPPKVSIKCRLRVDLPDEEDAALIASLEGSKMAQTAVQLLIKAAELNAGLKLGHLQMFEVELMIGLTTGVKVRYRDPSNPSSVS